MLNRWSKQIEQSYKNCREKHAGFKVKDKFPVKDPQNSPYMPNVAVSLDCSYKSWGWQQGEAVVAAIAENTDKILDVYHLVSDNSK